MPPKQCSTWIQPTSAPGPLETPRFVLEPLAEKHAELDFEALMSCRPRLRKELNWGEWPNTAISTTLSRITAVFYRSPSSAMVQSHLDQEEELAGVFVSMPCYLDHRKNVTPAPQGSKTNPQHDRRR